MAYIESQSKFNDFCTIPNTGMFFFAQEDVKMLTYYIPSLGPAPKWCSFLDNLAEEIESEVSRFLLLYYIWIQNANRVMTFLRKCFQDPRLAGDFLQLNICRLFISFKISSNQSGSFIMMFSVECLRKC